MEEMKEVNGIAVGAGIRTNDGGGACVTGKEDWMLRGGKKDPCSHGWKLTVIPS